MGNAILILIFSLVGIFVIGYSTVLDIRREFLMAKKSRTKGANAELEFAKLVGGVKVPMSGAMEGYSNDVRLPNGMLAEVKRRKEGQKQLYDWVLDEREKPDLVAFRADRKPWLITMTLDKFLYFLNQEAENARRQGTKADTDEGRN